MQPAIPCSLIQLILDHLPMRVASADSYQRKSYLKPIDESS